MKNPACLSERGKMRAYSQGFDTCDGAKWAEVIGFEGRKSKYEEFQQKRPELSPRNRTSEQIPVVTE